MTVPRNWIELYLVKLWEEVLNVSPIRISDNFFDIGGDSLSAIRLIAQFDQQFGRRISFRSFLVEGTVEHIAKLLADDEKIAAGTPLIKMQRGDGRLPLIIVHSGGGSLMGYSGLIRHLDAEQTIYGIQASGLEEDSKPISEVETMASRYIQAVQTAQPHGPYLLCGWCFGGLVAFEMAHQLERLGEKVALLILIDTPFPEEPRSSLIIDSASYWIAEYSEHLEMSELNLRMLSKEEQLDYVVEQLHMRSALPGYTQNTNLMLAKRVLRLHESHNEAISKYRPRPYQGAVVYFHAQPSRLGIPEESHKLWQELMSGKMEDICIPGNHWELMASPYIEVIAGHLQKFITAT